MKLILVLLVVVTSSQLYAFVEHKVDRSQLPEHLRNASETKGFTMSTCIYHYEHRHSWSGERAAYYCLELKRQSEIDGDY